MKKILLVEDDPNLAYVIKDGLKGEHFDVDQAFDGKEGWEKFQSKLYDLCLLDVMMPKIDGFDLARRIRDNNNQVPVLFITAKSMLEDKLEGFRSGGDDYITKPFSIEELILRMQVFLRRSATEGSRTDEFFQFGETKFFPSALRLETIEGSRTLTQRETELLLFFCMHPNQVIKRETILKAIWGNDDYFFGRSLDVFISKLRKYLKSEIAAEIINYHSVGFKFEANLK